MKLRKTFRLLQRGHDYAWNIGHFDTLAFYFFLSRLDLCSYLCTTACPNYFCFILMCILPNPAGSQGVPCVPMGSHGTQWGPTEAPCSQCSRSAPRRAAQEELEFAPPPPDSSESTIQQSWSSPSSFRNCPQTLRRDNCIETELQSQTTPPEKFVLSSPPSEIRRATIKERKSHVGCPGRIIR